MLKAWLGLALTGLVAFAIGQDPNGVVATVNGEAIKRADYYHRMEYLPGVGRFVGNRFAEMPPGFMTLDTLITERLVLQLAKSKGIYPTDPEVDAEYKHRLEDNPRYETDAKDAGLTREDLLLQVRLDLAQFKIVTFGINVTDQDVEDYYAKNPTKYTIPKRLRLRLIAVAADDDKAKVDAQLSAGKPFGDVAKALSQDTSKSIGGDLGFLPDYAFPDDVRAKILAAKIGKSTEWIKQGQAWVKYFYEDAKPEEKMPLSPALRRSIRRELMLVKGGIKNNLRDEMRDLRKAAKIEISQKDFADAYKKFIDQYLGTGG